MTRGIQQELLKKKKGESDAVLTGRAQLSLGNRYSRDKGWSLFFEVHYKKRRADCIAFNIYPARNFQIVGFEIKASRSNWLKELEHLEKSDSLIQQCDAWYIVEARPDIVKKGELPDGWGLLSLKGSRIHIRVRPTIDVNPEISREFFARVIEQSRTKNPPYHVIGDAERRGYNRGKREQQDNYEVSELRRRVKILDKLKDEDIKIHEWELEDIRRLRLALDFINKFGTWGIDNKLKSGRDRCKEAIKQIDEAEKLINKLKEMTHIKDLKEHW